MQQCPFTLTRTKILRIDVIANPARLLQLLIDLPEANN